MSGLKKIGYLSWRVVKGRKEDEEFSSCGITDGDRKAGFVCQPVYVKEDEKPG